MEPFELPHQHEDASHLHELKEYLRRTEYFQTVALVFRQLSDANRVRLFWLLCHCEECVVNLAAMMGMSPPALSHHLRQLRESGLIVSRRDGTRWRMPTMRNTAHCYKKWRKKRGSL